jgi:hypothetical protein
MSMIHKLLALAENPSMAAGAENGILWAISILKQPSYQDRLGTNMGIHSKKEGRFSQAPPAPSSTS